MSEPLRSLNPNIEVLFVLSCCWASKCHIIGSKTASVIVTVQLAVMLLLLVLDTVTIDSPAVIPVITPFSTVTFSLLAVHVNSFSVALLGVNTGVNVIDFPSITSAVASIEMPVNGISVVFFAEIFTVLLEILSDVKVNVPVQSSISDFSETVTVTVCGLL